MKRLFALIVLFLIGVSGVLWYYTGVLPNPAELLEQIRASDSDITQLDTEEIRACWVATAYAIDYPEQPTTDADALRSRCDAILDSAQAAGCNTIYLQVRPSADALYPSELFPWSRYLTGECGTPPSDDFDPLAYWLEQAHTRGMRLEAWINPYRICAGENAAADFDALPDSAPAKQHPEWVVACDGGYYFNPGLAEVRQLICDGVQEIVTQYAVDGVQFDDYFYPSTSFDDDAAYRASPDAGSRADWRRDNVNQLVQAVYDVVHTQAQNPDCVFGISPSGIWRNKGINVFGGSDTRGYEHYTSSYADSVKWIENGWIDYICPQIYWEIGNEAADFATLTDWWAHQVEGTDVQLLIGLAAYKCGDAENGEIWQNDGVGEIGRQIDRIRSIEEIDGYAIFSYSNLETTDGLSALLEQKCAAEQDAS